LLIYIAPLRYVVGCYFTLLVNWLFNSERGWIVALGVVIADLFAGFYITVTCLLLVVIVD